MKFATKIWYKKDIGLLEKLCAVEVYGSPNILCNEVKVGKLLTVNNKVFGQKFPENPRKNVL